MTDLQLKIYGVAQSQWCRCASVSSQYLREYPDRMGIRHGCVYVQEGVDGLALYVYRTKTMVIVRGG